MIRDFFVVIGETSSDIFTRLVVAENSKEALKIGKMMIKSDCYPRKVMRWSVKIPMF